MKIATFTLSVILNHSKHISINYVIYIIVLVMFNSLHPFLNNIRTPSITKESNQQFVIGFLSYQYWLVAGNIQPHIVRWNIQA